jgi:hypothetical protein
MNNLKQFKFKHIGEHAKPIIDKITMVAPSPNTIYKRQP